MRDQLRFNPTDLLEWATGRQLAVHVEAFEDDDPRDRPPSLATALEAGGVLAAIPSTDREGVVRAIVERLPLPASFDRELLVEVLLAREGKSVIAVADAIALPPARNPIIVAGTVPLVTVGYLANPVAFDAHSVRTMIVFISPTVRCHLRLLARLSRALADRDFRAAIETHAEIDVLVREAARVEALPPPEPVE